MKKLILAFLVMSSLSFIHADEFSHKILSEPQNLGIHKGKIDLDTGNNFCSLTVTKDTAHYDRYKVVVTDKYKSIHAYADVDETDRIEFFDRGRWLGVAQNYLVVTPDELVAFKYKSKLYRYTLKVYFSANRKLTSYNLSIDNVPITCTFN